MKHKLYIWETFESTIKLIQFNNYKELVEACEKRNYPPFKTPEFLEAFLSIGEKTIYSFPIIENHVKVLAYYDNQNFARKERDWFKELSKKGNNGTRSLSRKKKR